MRRLLRIGLVLCLAVLGSAPVFAQQDDAATATATAVLDRLDAGDFEGATSGFNAQMKAALGPDRLQGVQQKMEAAGPVLSREAPRISQRDGYTVVVVRIRRELAALDATVAIDHEGKIAGLHFVPASGGPQ
ncbi:DUF3887 domain-containing protein [Luteimonas viscosa]|nr:DUF3887 domain-containing protein [Luteimonas viscosa]